MQNDNFLAGLEELNRLLAPNSNDIHNAAVGKYVSLYGLHPSTGKPIQNVPEMGYFVEWVTSYGPSHAEAVEKQVSAFKSDNARVLHANGLITEEELNAMETLR